MEFVLIKSEFVFRVRLWIFRILVLLP
jgi:hypothetical protein